MALTDGFVLLLYLCSISTGDYVDVLSISLKGEVVYIGQGKVKSFLCFRILPWLDLCFKLCTPKKRTVVLVGYKAGLVRTWW